MPKSDEFVTLAELRRRSGLNQRQLANKLGWARARVSRVERHKDPMISTIRAYLSALGATLELNFISPHGHRLGIGGAPSSNRFNRTSLDYGDIRIE